MFSTIEGHNYIVKVTGEDAGIDEGIYGPYSEAAAERIAEGFRSRAKRELPRRFPIVVVDQLKRYDPFLSGLS